MRPGAEDADYLTSTGAPIGEIIQVMLDMDNYKVKFGNDDTWGAEVDLAATIGSSVGSYKEIFPIAKKLSWTGYVNFGQRPFKYTAPTDYKCLCTQNLDDVFSGDPDNDPSKYFNVSQFTGTGQNNGNQQIKTGSFSPDLVWTRPNAITSSWAMYDRLRGTNSKLYSNSNDAANTNSNAGPSAWHSDGLTLDDEGDNTVYNAANGIVYAWDAGTTAWSSTDNDVTAGTTASTGWTNRTAGFSIVQYEGNNSNTTVGHNLGAEVKFIIIKNIDQSKSWVVGHDSMGWDTHLWLNGTDHTGAQYDDYRFNSTAPSNTVFSLGSTSYTNADSHTHIAYCWAPIDGYSKFGSYIGKGTNNFIYTGFRPRWIMYKRHAANSSSDGSTTYTSWGIIDSERKPYNGLTGKTLWANRTEPEGRRGNATSTTSLDHIEVDFLSNGFFLDAEGSENNADTGGYIYAAFAEHPFKTARAK